jgi:3-dehydroquinate synthetase
MRRDELVSAPKKKRTSAAQPKKAAAARQDVINDYLDRLRNAGNRRVEFDSVVDTMMKDKRVRKPELNQIVSQYIGVRISMDKLAAEQILRKTFTEQIHMDRDFEIESKITPT